MQATSSGGYYVLAFLFASFLAGENRYHQKMKLITFWAKLGNGQRRKFESTENRCSHP